MSSLKTLIVQPWFAAPGHPAQSLVNTARALSGRTEVSYLLPRVGRGTRLEAMQADVAAISRVDTYSTPMQWLPVSTIGALFALVRRSDVPGTLIFFLDAHLVSLAACWPMVARRISAAGLAVQYLRGPERIFRNILARKAVKRFLSRDDTRLFLRTEELAAAWYAAVPETLHGKIAVLPSLEMSGAREVAGTPSSTAGPVRFLVAGQIRTGKSIARLIPMFRSHPELGTLTVAGAFSSKTDRAALSMLAGYPGFRDGYLDEESLLRTVAEHDYVLMLYEDWDHRMEAATLFLAARVGRPVICFDAGWCGRMLRTFGCGIAVDPLNPRMETVLASVPKRGSHAYASLVNGIGQFRAAHAPERLRDAFLERLLG